LTQQTKHRDARHRRGELAEAMARRLLLDDGLTLLAQNFHCKMGEIDLIFWDRGCLVFVEVRARANTNFAFPADTVDYRKQRKITLTAEYFLLQNPQYANNTCRFDVVGVDFSTHTPKIEWIKAAF
jgi:putative endonuclease